MEAINTRSLLRHFLFIHGQNKETLQHSIDSSIFPLCPKKNGVFVLFSFMGFARLITLCHRAPL